MNRHIALLFMVAVLGLEVYAEDNVISVKNPFEAHVQNLQSGVTHKNPITPPITEKSETTPISNKKVVVSPKVDENPIQNRDEMYKQRYGDNAGLYSIPDAINNKSDLRQSTTVMQGSNDSSSSNNNAIANMVGTKENKYGKKVNEKGEARNEALNNELYKDIDRKLTDKEELEKFMARRNSETQINNREIMYNFQEYKNTPIVIYLKRGYITTLEIVNEMQEPIRILDVSAGNKIFSINQPAQNILTLEPTSQYRTTNMNLRLNGYHGNITFKVIESEEGYEKTVDNLLKIVVSDTPINSSDSMTNFKMQVLQELYKYGTLRGGMVKQLSFDVIDVSKNATNVRYFNQNDLKVFRVQKFGKEMTIIQLNNKYEILGQADKDFGRYANSYDVYFMSFAKETFEIIKRIDIPSQVSSSPYEYESNIGMGEIYRIILK